MRMRVPRDTTVPRLLVARILLREKLEESP